MKVQLGTQNWWQRVPPCHPAPPQLFALLHSLLHLQICTSITAQRSEICSDSECRQLAAPGGRDFQSTAIAGSKTQALSCWEALPCPSALIPHTQTCKGGFEVALKLAWGCPHHTLKHVRDRKLKSDGESAHYLHFELAYVEQVDGAVLLG